MAENEVCSICLEEILPQRGRGTATLSCDHKFHLDCIGSEFNARGQMRCPSCRSVESGNWQYNTGPLPEDDHEEDNIIVLDDGDNDDGNNDDEDQEEHYHIVEYPIGRHFCPSAGILFFPSPPNSQGTSNTAEGSNNTVPAASGGGDQASSSNSSLEFRCAVISETSHRGPLGSGLRPTLNIYEPVTLTPRGSGDTWPARIRSPPLVDRRLRSPLPALGAPYARTRMNNNNGLNPPAQRSRIERVAVESCPYNIRRRN